MKGRILILPVVLLVLVFPAYKCISEMKSNEKGHAVKIFAHRGDKAYFPENSIPAFKSAVEKGADGIELDVVISKDRKVVVSHEPYMSSVYMLDPEKEPIPKNRERDFNFFEMTYDSIRKFDSGSRGNRKFPKQQKLSTQKPLLEEVFQIMEEFVAINDFQPIDYLIEIKSHPKDYGIYQPHPLEYIELVMGVVENYEIKGQVIIQSFDPAILNALNENHPYLHLSLLVNDGNLQDNLSLLHFKPEYYSPYHKLLKNYNSLQEIKEKKLKCIPWTVNERSGLRKMIRMGVDGIITDHPGRARDLM